jgi:tRNA U34 5-methylaminomethyl-2-thiouridine-forming methyltransferase MnmC
MEQEGGLVVWDVGLGAAANPIAVLNAVKGLSGKVQMISFDHTLEPLRFALSHPERLTYLLEHQQTLNCLLDQGQVRAQAHDHDLDWRVIVADFPTFISGPEAPALPKPQIILFDAFSPARNPAMWTYPVFRQLHQLLDPRRACALPTYSRSTMLRVTLLLAGFFVGVGHATGEKEETTIAANSPELIKEPLDRRWLERARVSKSAEPLWEPVYRQAYLTEESWHRLISHPQFQSVVRL